MKIQILKEMGFSEREIAVYKTLLRLGSSKAGVISKESGVQNSKIYETLEKLMKKGFVSYVYKDNIKYFQASSPDNLIDFFNKKKKDLDDVVSELEDIRSKSYSVYEARVFEGIKAIKSAFFEMYRHIGKGSEYYVFPIGEQLASEELVKFWNHVLREKNRLKIRVKTLPNIKLKTIFNKFYKDYGLVSIRYTKQEFPNGIFIFKDHVLQVTWGEKPSAFLIKSKENYESWKKFFDEQWKKAK